MHCQVDPPWRRDEYERVRCLEPLSRPFQKFLIPIVTVTRRSRSFSLATYHCQVLKLNSHDGALYRPIPASASRR